jgi:hypothetical protein
MSLEFTTCPYTQARRSLCSVTGNGACRERAALGHCRLPFCGSGLFAGLTILAKARRACELQRGGGFCPTAAGRTQLWLSPANPRALELAAA